MALQDVFKKKKNQKPYVERLVNIMTPSENQTLISILLEDPHLLIDLGCGVKQVFLISEGMYFTAFSFCISDILCLFLRTK